VSGAPLVHWQWAAHAGRGGAGACGRTKAGQAAHKRRNQGSGTVQRLLWPAARGGGAAAGVYTALKFGGLALRVASGLAASIGRDAERALSQLEPPPEPQARNLL